jgi:clamp loader A subunit
LSKRNPFDFIDDLSEKKLDVAAEGMTGYSPWLTNKFFAKFVDTVMYANEVNSIPHAPPRAQYDYYEAAIRPRRRRAKWPKKSDAKSDDLAALEVWYGINRRKAAEVALALGEEGVKAIAYRVSLLDEEERNARGHAG